MVGGMCNEVIRAYNNRVSVILHANMKLDVYLPNASLEFRGVYWATLPQIQSTYTVEGSTFVQMHLH